MSLEAKTIYIRINTQITTQNELILDILVMQSNSDTIVL